MKKLIIYAIAAIAALGAQAQEGTTIIDGIRYSLNDYDPIFGATATLEAYDPYSEYANNGQFYYGDMVIPSQVTCDGITYKVTNITPGAFRNCTKLTSIVIPEAITSLGSRTFYACTALEKVIWHDKIQLLGEEIFYGCSSLKSIEIPAATTKIGNSTFRYCSSLESVTFNGNKVTTIGELAFYGTVSLIEIKLPSSVKSIETWAFYPDSYNYDKRPSKLIWLECTSVPTLGDEVFQSYYTIVVPTASYNDYVAAWPDLEYSLVPDAETSYTINASALDNDSDLLRKIVEGRSENQALYVVDLKVSGTINSYDILAIRNKMLNLHNLDLNEARIVANDYPYYRDFGTVDNEVSAYMFYGLPKLTTCLLPQTTKSIGNSAFHSCNSLKEMDLPKSLTNMEQYAFCSCLNLKKIIIPPSIKTIPDYCFSWCENLEYTELPTGLKSIGIEAFYCTSLKNVKIPSSIVKIEDLAFSNSPIADIYTWTIIPTKIDQNTFGSDIFTRATIHVPETSEKIYWWDTQWGQFQKIESFNEPYTYFYLEDIDLFIDEETARIEGEEVEGEIVNPDADLGVNAGLVVEGNESQDLGEVNVDVTTSIIGGESADSQSGDNINIDRLVLNIDIVSDSWYFFCFPFDVPKNNIQFNGQFQWCYYDGEYRAEHGSGAWRNAEGNLNANQGYIFIGSKNGTLKITVENVSIGADDQMIALQSYPGASQDDASWNLVGNPYTSYYNLADLGYTAPITIWNPETGTYEAYSPDDDDIVLYPYQAFFVQKPDDCEGVEFDSEYRETAQDVNNPEMQQAAKRRRMARARSMENRFLCNIEMSDGRVADKTRVVFNDNSDINYEIGRDASKFISDRASQLYTLDAKQVRYAINERPMAEGYVHMGFIAIADGTYTINATRLDTPLYLIDLETGVTTDLATDSYAFNAESGVHNDRLVLSTEPDLTSAAAIAAEAAATEYYDLRGIKRGHDMPTGISITSQGQKMLKK